MFYSIKQDQVESKVSDVIKISEGFWGQLKSLMTTWRFVQWLSNNFFATLKIKVLSKSGKISNGQNRELPFLVTVGL